MKETKSPYHGHRFPAVIISCAVRWYFRFSLSLRDIEELMLERGVVVTYETIRCWCDKFGARFAQCAKAARRKPGSTWHLDELFVTLRGEPYLLWRAVDEHGADLDVLVQKRRNKAAAKRFFKRLLRSNPVPRRIVTDQLRSYPAEGRDSRARSCEARFRQSSCTREQPRREQPPADPQARTPDVRLSRSASHAAVSLILRPDPAALRVAQTSDDRGLSSCRTQRTLRRMACLDCLCRSRENYLIRITTLERHR
ncbi:transposase-like protein [Paraburkholderia sp. MM5496-R1]